MMIKQFTNRKEQIEQGFLKTLVRDLKIAGLAVEQGEVDLIKETLRLAAMAGACEERNRTLRLLRGHGVKDELIKTEIMLRSVLEVLGYE